MKNIKAYNAGRSIAWKGWWASLLLLLLIPAVTACDGGVTVLLAGGGIGGTGIISVGTITAFGSIWVNGVEYNIIDANIIVNGVAAEQTDLTRGMIVEIKGTINQDGINGKAASVSFNRDLAGQVTAVDLENHTITILGQTVSWDNETFSDDNEPGTWLPPALGTYVEISALPTANGWLARAINNHEQEVESELAGVLDNLDTANRTFTINTLEIHYTGMTSMQNGDFVKVSGQLQGSIFIASHIEIHKPELAGDNEDMEVEGMVSEYDFNSKMLTMLGPNGQYAIDTAGAVFEHGVEVELVSGARIEVDGYVQDGIFFAEKIEFKKKN